MAYLAGVGLFALLRPRLHRATASVVQEYSDTWRAYERRLDECASVDDWLAAGAEEPRYFNGEGELRFDRFDWAAYYRKELLRALDRHFPNARSLTEYGSGLGRNLLFLARARPGLKLYGYELCRPGVEIGRKAAARFGCDVEYRQLDMVNSADAEFALPPTDVAFTMFALEQLPHESAAAMRRIHERVRLGSLHIEPVPENYPLTYRGIIGRLDHWKADYLRGFERTVRSLPVAQVHRLPLGSSHNPLMFPTLYALRK